jgi:hypothetical protein
MLWDFSIGMGLGKKSSWILGWNYDSMSFTENTGTINKLGITDMGPKITYYIDKEHTWLVSFTYGLISKGTYTAGSAAAVEMRGTSMKADLGYVTPMNDIFALGIKLTYYKASFGETISNQTTIAKTTNGRTVIYPNIAFLFRFE